MNTATAFAGFAAFSLLVTVTPGPDTLLVLRNCLRGGRRSGWATGLGAAAGSLVWAVVAATGLAAALHRWDVAYLVVRLAGAGYLVLLGGRTLWALRRAAPPAEPFPAPPPAGPAPARPAFRQGLTSCVLNPKVGVFFLAVVPQFLPRGHPTFAVTLAFGVIDAAIAAGWLTFVSLSATRMLGWLRRPRVNRLLETAAGAVLLALGLAAVAESV